MNKLLIAIALSLAVVACDDPAPTAPIQPSERDPLEPRCKPLDRNCKEP
jgi:hypothetical protein